MPKLRVPHHGFSVFTSPSSMLQGRKQAGGQGQVHDVGTNGHTHSTPQHSTP